jgi:hypothetical protein
MFLCAITTLQPSEFFVSHIYTYIYIHVSRAEADCCWLQCAGNNSMITLRCGLRRSSLNRVYCTSAQFGDLSLVVGLDSLQNDGSMHPQSFHVACNISVLGLLLLKIRTQAPHPNSGPSSKRRSLILKIWWLHKRYVRKYSNFIVDHYWFIPCHGIFVIKAKLIGVSTGGSTGSLYTPFQRDASIHIYIYTYIYTYIHIHI